MKLFIPIMYATSGEHRPSLTELSVGAVSAALKATGAATEIFNAGELGLTRTNRELDTDQKKQLSAKLTQADGYVVVSPEYNHGYPGELKIMLDTFEMEFKRKPIGIIGVSNGGIGGARMVEQLRLVAIALSMVPITMAVYFSNTKSLFGERGEFLAKEKYEPRFKKFFEELFWYAAALKKARGK